MRRNFSMLITIVLSGVLAVGCGSDINTVGTQIEASTQKIDSQEETEAAKLLVDLKGSYTQLWPVLLDDKYTDLWISDCAKFVGDENAKGAYTKLSSMVTGTVIGQEAVEKYANGEGMAYDCEFINGVNILTFDGNQGISATDVDGNELFRHTYHFIGMEEVRGLYIYESDDDNSGEFTFFAIAPDTMETTQHIELRYGGELEQLRQYSEGNYAYWLASGISIHASSDQIEDCILLFCEENLTE